MDVEITQEEANLIGLIRGIKVDFGRIGLTVYIQHGKMIRVEYDRVVESKTLSTVNN